MPENILSLAAFRFAGLVDDTMPPPDPNGDPVPPPDPNGDDDEEEDDEGEDEGSTISQSSGNPNPTNSPQPLYEAYAGSAQKTRPV